MARAPIIISNGGVAGRLAEGLHDCKSQLDAENELMKNFWNLLDDSEVMIIKNKRGHEAFCLYWRLKNGDNLYENIPKEKKPKNREGKEGVSITDLFDSFIE